MSLALAPILENIDEDLSLQECLDKFLLNGSSIGTKISTLFVLAKKYSSGSELDENTSNTILSSFPKEFVDELLCVEESEYFDYQKFLIDIYAKLLSVCSDSQYEEHLDIVKRLVRFIKNRFKDLSLSFDVLSFLVRAPIRNDQKLVHEGLRLLVTFATENNFNPWPLDLLNLCSGLVMLITDLNPDSTYDWEKKFLSVVGSIVKAPPNRLDGQFKMAAFGLADAVTAKRGPTWFEKDCQLLCLIAHLATGELRIILDNPGDIEFNSLSICLDLLEMSIRAVDDEDFMNDDDSLKISKAIQEASSFIVSYWVGAQDIPEEKLKLTEPICELFYRYLCNLFSYGGEIFLQPDDIKKVAPLLAEVFKKACLDQDDIMAVGLIRVIGSIKYGNNSALLFKDFLSLTNPTCPDKFIVKETIESLKNLSTRCDWYNKETMTALRATAGKFVTDPKILKVLKEF